MSERLTPCPVCGDDREVYVAQHPNDPNGDYAPAWMAGECPGCAEREATGVAE